MTALNFEMQAALSAEESQLAERLAQARAALRDATAAWQERLRWLKANAEELFARRQRDIFQADLKAWRADPFANDRLFGKTALSAAWLKNFWQGILAGVSSPIGITFEQAKDVVTSAGGDWRADRIDAFRGNLMGFFLTLSPRPEAALRQWVAESLGTASRRSRQAGKPAKSTGAGTPKGIEPADDESDFETVMARARHFFKPAQTRDQARAGLAKIAAAEMKLWPGETERLRALELDELARCAEGAACQELGRAADIRETRRIRRELARAERQVDQCERRLAALRRKIAAKPSGKRAKAASQESPGSLEQKSSVEFRDFETSGHGTPTENASLQSGSNESDGMQSTESDSSNAIAIASACDIATNMNGETRSRNLRRPDPAKLAKTWRKNHELLPRKRGNAIESTC